MDSDELDMFDLSIAGEGGWGEDLDYGESVSVSLASAGARHLLVSSADKVKHSAVHAAAVKHAAHKKSGRARSGGASSPSMPRGNRSRIRGHLV